MTSPRVLADRLVEKTFKKAKLPQRVERKEPKPPQSIADRIKDAQEARKRSRATTEKIRNL